MLVKSRSALGSKLERPGRTGVGLPPLGQSKGALPVSRGRGYEGRSYERGPCGPRSTTSSVSHLTPRGDVRSGSELGLLPKPGRYFKYSWAEGLEGCRPPRVLVQEAEPRGPPELPGESLGEELPQATQVHPSREHCPLGAVVLSSYSGGCIFLPLSVRLGKNPPLRCPGKKVRA